jgi:hypothetical protein
LSHRGLQVSHLERTVVGGLSETVSHGLVGVAAKDGGVCFGLGVLAELIDSSWLDTEGSDIPSLVTTVQMMISDVGCNNWEICILRDNLDFAVCAHHACGRKGENEKSRGIHLEGESWMPKKVT